MACPTEWKVLSRIDGVAHGLGVLGPADNVDAIHGILADLETAKDDVGRNQWLTRQQRRARVSKLDGLRVAAAELRDIGVRGFHKHIEFILDLLKATPRPTESTISSAISRIWQDASSARKSLFPKLVLRVVASARNSLKSFSTGARLAPSMLRICKASQSGGTDEQPPKVRRRLTRVTSTASAISVASSVFDVDDNTPSTVAHKTIYHSVVVSYSTSHRSTSAVPHLARSATTSDLPPCPRPMRFQKGPLADMLTRRLWRWCAFITIISSSEQCSKIGPSGFGVAKFLDEAVSCGICGALL